MKYVKAQAVFPRSLLDEMQKYVQGELVYIPKTPDNYLKWGAGTGAKRVTAQRNKAIRQAHRAGVSIVELTSVFFLSEETIKKIVYSSK